MSYRIVYFSLDPVTRSRVAVAAIVEGAEGVQLVRGFDARVLGPAAAALVEHTLSMIERATSIEELPPRVGAQFSLGPLEQVPSEDPIAWVASLLRPRPDIDTARLAWLEAVEAFAVRASDAQLALALLGARHHDDAAHNASVLSELARVSSESSAAVIENGKRTAAGCRSIGACAAELCAEGWRVMEGRGAHTTR